MVSPTYRSAKVALAPAYARTERRARRPQNPFNVVNLPFLITPVMFHPVLPGETLKSLLIQSQCWSDPLNAQLKNLGWWLEYNCWYVKHRDLTGWEIATDGLGKDLIDMFVSNESLTSHETATAITRTYTAPGGVDFCTNALNRVIEEYYRDEGETFATSGASYSVANELFSLRKAQIYPRGRDDAFKKLTMAANYADRRQELDADNDGNIYVGDEMDRAYNEWAAAHDAGLIDMTYEDWMRTYGGTAGGSAEPDRVDYHRPEDIGHSREFTYPTNTVEPTTGVPAVAVGWRTAQAIRKSHRFNEPGWIMVTQVIRPKMYLGKQEGSVASWMKTRDSWLPAVLNAESTVGHTLIDDLTGPLAAIMAADYMIDIRDLLLYGEQFTNLPQTSNAYTQPGFAQTLPNNAAQRRYVDDTSINAMFADTTNGRFRTDGMISLNILGRQTETTQNLVLTRR